MPTTADERAYADAAPEQPQERADFQDWFKRHQTAILIVGVTGVVLTAVVIFRGQSQSNAGAAGVAPAATVDSSTSQALNSMTQALQNLLNTLSSGGGGGTGTGGGSGGGGGGGGRGGPPNPDLNPAFRTWLMQQGGQAPNQLAWEQFNLNWAQLMPYLYSVWQSGGSIDWNYIVNYPNPNGGNTGGAGGWPPAPGPPPPRPVPPPSPSPPPGSWQPVGLFNALRARISFPPQPGSGQVQATTFTYSGPPGSTIPPGTIKAAQTALATPAPAPPTPAQPGATGIAWSAGGAPSFLTRVESRRP